MIIDIRRHLRGHAYRFVVILAVIGIIISFALPPVIKQIGRDAEWVISVNGSEISEKIFRHRVSQQQEFLINFRQQYGPYADMLLESMGVGRDPQQLAFNLLVKEELLLQTARKIGIVVHSDEIGEKLGNPQFIQQDLAGLIPPYFVSENGILHEKSLRRYLQKIGVTIGQFETSVVDAIARRMVSQLAFATSYVPLFDVRQYYIAHSLAKKFSIATVSLDTYLKKEKQESLASSEVQEFFDQQNANSARYVVPEKRAGIMWIFDPLSYGFKISDKEIESYYEEHKTKDYLVEPTKIQIRRILLKIPEESQATTIEQQALALRQELVMGASFESKAKEMSQDSATAKQGGLMPVFARGEQSAAIERVAFLLKDDGEISPVFRSNDGFEILQRVSKKMRTFKSLSAVSSAIKTQLMKDKFKHQFMADMKLLVDRQGDLDERIASFVKEQSAKKKPITLMSNDGSPLARALFSIAKAQGLEFYVDGETGVAVQLVNVEAKFTPTLDSVKAAVMHDMYHERARMRMKEDLARIASGDNAVEEAQRAGAKVEKTGWLTPENGKELKDLESKGIITGKMLQLEKIGSSISEISDQYGFIVTLAEKEEIDEAKFLEESVKIGQTLATERSAAMLEGFIASLYRTATLTTNESILNLYQEYSI